MKVIFLDVDGVLNHFPGRKAHGMHFIDPQCVKLVDELAIRTGAHIVASSTWRKFHPPPELETMLRALGLTAPWAGQTPIGDASGEQVERGVEIRIWLTAHPEVEGFVILDDNADMEKLRGWLVQTPDDTGIEKRHAEQAERILQRPLDKLRKRGILPGRAA